jgi:class 3 adenylate cyclase
MPTQEVKRKLTAILSADVKGYSRLMGADEEGTLHTLTAYREVMTALIQQHQGRVVNAPGDALLAEFESVVDAVKSAVEIQRELTKRNADLPNDRRMEYRIGINLGDVMVEGEAIYGDGINIAARMESLADGGGICISGIVYDQIENKLSLGYKYLGEQTVKNITKPVRVGWNLHWLAKPVLDMGAMGVVMPQVNSKQEAVDAAQALRYPPEGVRGMGAGFAALRWGLSIPEYLKIANKEIMVILLIEHAEAVNRIDEILTVPGIDLIFVGPGDLSASMGLLGQVTHIRVEKSNDYPFLWHRWM